MRPETRQQQILWELQAIRQHLHHIATALTNALNRIELVSRMVDRIHPMPADEEDDRRAL